MDRQGKDGGPPTWLYGLIGLVVCAVLFVGYSWLTGKWGHAVILVEVGIVVVIVIVGVMLSLRRSPRSGR